MEQWQKLEQLIGITFKNKHLLENAFVHRSYLNEHKKFFLPSNEKLEFLGDSVLSLITSIYLYKKYPHLAEGEYTDIKATIVRTESLYEAAKNLGLGDHLYLSKGEEENDGRKNKSLLADCFEALIAAIFLDKNFEAAYRFVIKFLFGTKLDQIVEKKLYLSAKNKLQEYWQEKYKKLPHYQIINQSGPEHHKKYLIGVFFEGKKLGEGIGNSKKEAEESAANQALKKLKI